MVPVFSGTILRKYRIQYYYCEESGLLQTEKPYWLEEAYQQAIALTDTGIAARNIRNSVILETILTCLGLENGKFVDVAGGYGLLTRLMRDKGFDCYSTDKYCQNLFAKPFEPDSALKPEAIFAFEVLEHIEDPLQFFEDVFGRYGCRTVIFSTLTFTGAIPSKDWWYYSFETGQHIAFYRPSTLSLLASRVGCRYYMLHPGIHIITPIQLTAITRALLLNRYVRRVYSLYVRLRRKGLSKTLDDHLKIGDHLHSD